MRAGTAGASFPRQQDRRKRVRAASRAHFRDAARGSCARLKGRTLSLWARGEALKGDTLRSTEGMIHELLLALSGYPGSIFTWNKRSGLQVSQDFPFLHPSETSVLNRLCRLGTDYIRFTEFIEQYTGHVQQQDHHPSQQGQGGLHGIYLRAFCTGLDSVLQPYRQALLDLEQEFLADPHLSVSHVNYSLDQFQLLFPSVMVVVEQIKSQKIHGCQILETVYKHSCGGLPPVRSALEKILAVCHGVMYKQLSAWMLHGLLLDQYEEFFIKQGPSSGNPSAQPEEDEEDLGIGGLTGKQLRELQDLVRAQHKAHLTLSGVKNLHS